MRRAEADAALAATERLLAIEAQGLLLDADASLAAAVASAGPRGAAVGARASAVQHRWADLMREAHRAARVLRAVLGDVPDGATLAPSAALAASRAALAGVDAAEGYVPVGSALRRAARALAAGDVPSAAAEVDAAEGRAPRPAGSAAPSPTTPCDPDETPRDCRARQQGERDAARAAEEQRAADRANAIRQVGQVVRSGLEAVDAATTGAADARNAERRNGLLVAGAEGDVALARSSRRVTVPAPTAAPMATPPAPPPTATPGPESGPPGATAAQKGVLALVAGIGTAAIVGVAGLVGFVSYRQRRQSAV